MKDFRKKRHIPAPYAAWVAIDIDRLVPEGGLMEIKAVADVEDIKLV